jgi:large subunit ribosomal protein L25
MSTQVTLHAQLRDGRGKGAARKLRADGRVPAVVYGKEADTMALSVDAKEAEHLFQAISVENTIVELDIDGEGESFPTLVREIQVHPIRPLLLHVDFYRIQAGVKVEVEVPVNLNGVPEGVKSSGGVLQQVVHDLPVRVLPSQIPETVELDVTGLEMGDAIHIYDLELGDEVEILLEAERTIASVVAPKILAADEEDEAEEEVEVELIGEEGEEVPVVEDEEEPEAEAEG